MRDDRSDEIADALDWLHAGGWSVGDTAFFDIENSDQVWVVTGSNGENMIWAESATCAEAWQRALDQAAACGLLPGQARPARGRGGGECAWVQSAGLFRF
jgi:hypothetical protein